MVASHNFDVEQAPLEAHGYILIAQDGDKRRALRLYDGRAIIGSHPSCHLQVLDHTVSRCHLEVIVTEKGLAIRDLSSTNGTWVDGERIPAATVDIGDTVTIGLCEITILALLEPREPCARPWARVRACDDEEEEFDGITAPEGLVI